MSDNRVSWHPISYITYIAIYHDFETGEIDRGAREGRLRVFGVHTCHDGECMLHGETHVYTEWGLPESDYPMIRSIRDGDQWTYFIASIVRGDDDE